MSINLCRFEINAYTQSGMWIHVQSTIDFYLLSILRHGNKESTLTFLCWLSSILSAVGKLNAFDHLHSSLSLVHSLSLSSSLFFRCFFQLSSIQPVDERVLSAHIAYRIYLNGNHSVVDVACFLHSTPHEMTTTITDNHSMHVNISAQKRENKTFWNCNRTWFYDLFITNGLVCVFVVGSLPSDWLNR